MKYTAEFETKAESTGIPDPESILRTGLWLHDEGYCVIAKTSDDRPTTPVEKLPNRRPKREHLMQSLTQPNCKGIGVAVGNPFQLAILEIDHFHSLLYLDEFGSRHWSEDVLWHKTSIGLRIWFARTGAPTGAKTLSRDGVTLFLEGACCPCPPNQCAASFNGPVKPATELPPLPSKLVEWLLAGNLSDAEIQYSRPPHSNAGRPGDDARIATYFWTIPRAPLPSGSSASTLQRVTEYYLPRTQYPYRLIAELVRRATQIDGLNEEEAIACCDKVMLAFR